MLFILMVAGQAAPAAENVKSILKNTAPSIVKVIAENHKRYVATGISLDKSHVVSTMEVIRRPYHTIYIRTFDGKDHPARLVGKDHDTSLILLEIKKKVLTPIKKGGALEAGDWAALVGLFYGKFPAAIYQGIASNVSGERLLLNAPVFPGASGGAVVNKKGELVGLIRGRFGYSSSPDYTFKDHSTEFFVHSSRNRHKDLCYAVPMLKVTDVTGDLKKYGKVKRGWLGVSITDYRGRRFTPTIDEVIKGSPAEKAGIRKNDILLAVNGETVRTGRDAALMLRALKPKQKAKIDILRGKTKRSVLAVIGENDNINRFQFQFTTNDRPRFIPEISGDLPHVQNYTFSFTGARSLGVDVMLITPQLAEKFDVDAGCGLMVSNVHKDSAAAKAGLEPADIIFKAGGKKLKKLADLRFALAQLEDNQPIVLLLSRKGKTRKLKMVPNKSGEHFFGIFDKLKNRMKRINIEVDEQDRTLTSVKETELKQYKDEVDRLKKEQELLKKRMELMLKHLEQQAAAPASKKKKKQK